jgi:hypothetical protein
MLNHTTPMIEPERGEMLAHLNGDHWDWGRGASMLEAAGGRRCFPGTGAVFRFISRPGRDDALDQVRRRFGWSVASPHGMRPGRCGRPPFGIAVRDEMSVVAGWSPLLAVK